jgi:hypothetical protein
MFRRLTLALSLVLLGGATASARPWSRICGRPRVHRAIVVVRSPALTAPRETEAAMLRFRFDKAPKYYAEHTTETRQAITVMGQTVNQRQTQSFFLAWTPKGMTPDGHGVMEMEFLAIKMDIDIGGVKIDVYTYDDAPAANPVAVLLAGAVGSKVQFHVTPLGNIVSVIGAEELRRKLANMSVDTEELVVAMFSRDALKTLAASFFECLPEQPVRPDYIWGWRGRTSMGLLGDFELVSRFRYAGRAKELDKIQVRRRLAFRPQKDSAELLFQIKKAALSDGTGTGDILFDRVRGRLASADIQQHLAGTLTGDVAGNETSVVISHTQVQRIRTSDRPLLSK